LVKGLIDSDVPCCGQHVEPFCDQAETILASRSSVNENKRIALAVVVGDTAADSLDESAMDFSGRSSLVCVQAVDPAQILPEITVKSKECLVVRLMNDFAVISESPAGELATRELGSCQHRHKLPA
jgi:hypothetical protein